MKIKNILYTIAFALIYTICILLIIFILNYYRIIKFMIPLSFIHIFSLALFIFILSLALEYFFFKKLYHIHILLLSKKMSENLSSKGNIKQIEENIYGYTQEKELEVVLLKDREKFRRQFLGNVSHELKTPLFSIQGYLLTLIEGGIEDLNIRDKYLDRINKSVERLIYIVKDLDILGQLETGKLNLSIQPFNIIALSQEIFDLLEIKAAHNNVNLQFKKNYIDPIYVMGDIEKIRQVLINLVANAIIHSNKENCEVILSFKVKKDKVRVSINDTGNGIEEEHLSRIFERFYRVDEARNRKTGGSGLGLAIVKHILEAHNSIIEVFSSPGEGTSFKFTLKKSTIN